MAINQNHLFEDLEGQKCAVVEKNCRPERVQFLRGLLAHNGYSVIVVPSPPPKAVAAVAGAEATVAVAAPETFTVGVTDVTFNATNAIFGRLLKTRDGHIVTLAYWQQKEQDSHDEVPYFEAG